MNFRIPSAAEVDAKLQEKRPAPKRPVTDSASTTDPAAVNSPTIAIKSTIPQITQSQAASIPITSRPVATSSSSSSASTSTTAFNPSLTASTSRSSIGANAASTSATTSSSSSTLPRSSPNSILVHSAQRGNPILEFVNNVPYEFASDILSDYVMGRTTCALYLSIRYHRLHPDYIYQRIKRLHQQYELRILLIQVDVDDHQAVLRELSKMAIVSHWTCILAWSHEEAGRYLETFKAYENKPADLIKEKVDGSHLARATDFLTAIKGINKTDVITLLTTFGTVRNILHASPEELLLLPGFGEQKVKRLYEAFRQPFQVGRAGEEQQEQEQEDY